MTSRVLLLPVTRHYTVIQMSVATKDSEKHELTEKAPRKIFTAIKKGEGLEGRGVDFGKLFEVGNPLPRLANRSKEFVLLFPKKGEGQPNTLPHSKYHTAQT